MKRQGGEISFSNQDQPKIPHLTTSERGVVDSGLPSDLLSLIFSQVPHPNVKNKPSHGDYLSNPTYCPWPFASFWLACRTVSKSWNNAITRMDWSTLGKAIVSGEPHEMIYLSKMLTKFKFSALDLRNTTFSPSLVSQFTGLTSLDLVTARGEVFLVTLLTNLKSLGLRITPLTEIQALTNLESLTVSGHGPKDLSPLTKLRSLCLSNNNLKQANIDLHVLTNLTDIQSNNPSFFRSGVGRCNYPDKVYYIGEWRNGKRQGHGFCYYGSSGGTYEGQWNNDERHGKGLTRFMNKAGEFDGTFYDGDSVESVWKGKGLRMYRFGETYDGDLTPTRRFSEYGVKHGKGVYRFRDGSVYEGQWSEDEICGQGKCFFANGDVYTGKWSKGRFQNPSFTAFCSFPFPSHLGLGPHFAVHHGYF